jgi:hypothetical protein
MRSNEGKENDHSESIRYTGPRTRRAEYVSMILFLNLKRLFVGISSAWKTDGFETFNSLATAARVFRAAILHCFAISASSDSVTILGTGQPYKSLSQNAYTFSLKSLVQTHTESVYEG